MTGNCVSILEYLLDKEISEYETLMSSYKKMMMGQDHGVILNLFSPDYRSKKFRLEYVLSEDKLYINEKIFNRDDYEITVYSSSELIMNHEVINRQTHHRSDGRMNPKFIFDKKLYNRNDIAKIMMETHVDEEVMPDYYRYNKDDMYHVYMIEGFESGDFENAEEDDNLAFIVVSDKEYIQFGYNLECESLNILMWKDNLVLLYQHPDNDMLAIDIVDIYTREKRCILTSLPIEDFNNAVIYDHCAYICDIGDEDDTIMKIEVVNLQSSELASFVVDKNPDEVYNSWICSSDGILYMMSDFYVSCMRLPTWSIITQTKPFISKVAKVKCSDKTIKVKETTLKKFDFFVHQDNFNRTVSKPLMELKYPSDVLQRLVKYVESDSKFSIASMIEMIYLCDFLGNADIKRSLYIDLYLQGYDYTCVEAVINIMNIHDCRTDEIIDKIFTDWLYLHRATLSNLDIQQLYEMHVQNIADILSANGLEFSLTGYKLLVKEVDGFPMLVKVSE